MAEAARRRENCRTSGPVSSDALIDRTTVEMMLKKFDHECDRRSNVLALKRSGAYLDFTIMHDQPEDR
jgi:hypothetical protein